MVSSTATTVDGYIADFPEETRLLLEQMRQTIRQAAPQATECIKYAIPSYVWHGNLVHFAGYKRHIGFYPGPTGIMAYQEQLAAYPVAKGTVQFPLHLPLPLALIGQIVALQVQENEEKALQRKIRRTCENGHKYQKTSDCPTCPVCEAARQTPGGFLIKLTAPARRALENNGISSLEELATNTEKEILAFHGMGKSSLPTLRQALEAQGLAFRK